MSINKVESVFKVGGEVFRQFNHETMLEAFRTLHYYLENNDFIANEIDREINSVSYEVRDSNDILVGVFVIGY